MKKLYAMIAAALLPFAANADLLDQARDEVTRGDWWKAEETLDQALAANPRLTANAQYNYLLGACKFETGNYPEALSLLTSAKAKGNSAANLYLGRLAFLEYDFDKAAAYYKEYKNHRERSGQVVGETVERLENQLAIAENALENVEKIVVIDSIAIPLDDFFTHYKLSASAGRLISGKDMPLEKNRPDVEVAFINEGGDYMVWSEPDKVGNNILVESTRFTDGTWDDPSPLPSFLHKGGYANYPFMMPDGVTLYYASTGDGSMGGYDIFVVRRDPQTGEFRQPANVGMPFNSPHDDYMLAVDEERGIGWWVTDRNLLGDKLTLYVYVVNDLRKNYDEEDEEEIITKARISDYKSTWNPADKLKYEELLGEIAETGEKDGLQGSRQFFFPLGKGKAYHNLSDFKSVQARVKMEEYLAGEKKLAKMNDELRELRKRYPVNRADNVKEDILRLEKESESLIKENGRLRSEVYRLEKEKQ